MRNVAGFCFDVTRGTCVSSLVSGEVGALGDKSSLQASVIMQLVFFV